MEKNNSLLSKVLRLYPFKEEEFKQLESAPLVDAAVMRMVRHVTLPLEDTITFRDTLDRRIDSDLKTGLSYCRYGLQACFGSGCNVKSHGGDLDGQCG